MTHTSTKNKSSNSPTPTPHNIPVIILAAGASSRTFPLNAIGNKGFFELAGQTLLERTIVSLIDSSFTNLYVVVSEKDKNADVFAQIQKSILDTYQVELHLVVQDKPTGMGDAILATKNQHPAIREYEHFGVVGPYSIKRGPHIKSLVTKIQEQPNSSAILVSETDEPWKFGIIKKDEADHITSIVEKPDSGTEPSNLRIVLGYLLHTDFWQTLQETKPEEYSFEAALNTYIKTNSTLAVKIDTTLPSLKYSWDTLEMLKKILHLQEKSSTHPSSQISKTAILDDSNGPIVIAENAQVGDFAKIIGPAYIGSGAFVGDYAYVRHSSIESEATVGAKTEVARSLIMAGATVHYGYVGDSILGPNCRIGAGLITANKRLDRSDIQTKVKEEMVSSRLTAFGCIIGPEANIGIGVRTMPGILIASKAKVEPSSVVRKNIETIE